MFFPLATSGTVYLCGQPVSGVSVGQLKEANGLYFTHLETDYSGSVSYTIPATPTPANVKIAMLLLVSHLYENRSAVTEERMNELPYGVERLLSSYKVVTP